MSGRAMDTASGADHETPPSRRSAFGSCGPPRLFRNAPKTTATATTTAEHCCCCCCCCSPKPLSVSFGTEAGCYRLLSLRSQGGPNEPRCTLGEVFGNRVHRRIAGSCRRSEDRSEVLDPTRIVDCLVGGEFREMSRRSSIGVSLRPRRRRHAKENRENSESPSCLHSFINNDTECCRRRPRRRVRAGTLKNSRASIF